VKRYVWVLLALAALLLMGVGLSHGQWTVVKRHADALCTACIGLTVESGHP